MRVSPRQTFLPLSLATAVCMSASWLSGCADAQPDAADVSAADEHDDEVKHATLDLVYGLGSSGSGCPSGSWSTSGKASDVSLRFNFKQFSTTGGGPVEPRFRSCTLTIPSTGLGTSAGVPENAEVAITQFVVSGMNRMSGQFLEGKIYATAGVVGGAEPQRVRGDTHFPVASPDYPYGYPFTQTIWIPVAKRIFRQCGDRSDLRVTISPEVRSTSSGGTFGMLDITEVRQFHIEYRKCP